MLRPAAVVALAALALWLGVSLAPHILVDDAAITLRYAERLATGHGFSYNDHERVLGASNPLYVLALSLLVRLGAGPETVARGLALAIFVACVLLAAHLAARLSGPAAGLVAGVLLASDDAFRSQALSGMEVGASVCLGLLVILSLLEGREAAAGFCLGLAVWNKLDAALLALAVAGTWSIVARRSPGRIAVVALLTVLPWWLFAFWYFGSPVPHSLLAKLSHPGAGFSPQRWVLGFLWGRAPLVLAATGFVASARRSEPIRRAGLVLLGWVALHALAYGAVNLGAPYPWYLAPLLPPLIVLAAGLFGAALHARHPPLAVLAALLIAAGAGPALAATVRDLRAGNPIEPWEAFEADRRLAGIFLGRYAAPDEVVESGYGWVAFESRRPLNDGTGLNSVAWLSPVAYAVEHGSPYDAGSHPPVAPEGMIALASFSLASDLTPGQSWFTVFGTPASRTARAGPRYLQWRLAELPPPAATEGVRLSGLDLEMTAPAGATFVVHADGQPAHIVFTPRLGPGPGADAGFEVRQGGHCLWSRHVRPGEVVPPQRVDLTPEGPAFAFSLIAAAPGRGAVAWRNVKVVVGAADLALERLGDRGLIEAWGQANPIPANIEGRCPASGPASSSP